MKMTQFAKFANNATKQILGTSGLIRENLQSMFSYPNAIDTIPVIVSGDVIHIEDAAPLDAENVTVDIEPVQDLHGYENPWPAGGGKNKHNPDEDQNNKWINNTTGEIESADGFWITGFIPVKAGDIIRSTPKGSARNAWYSADKSQATYFAFNGDSGTSATAPSDGFVVMTVLSSTIAYGSNFIVTINNADLTFSPYSNICPITGWTGANITVNDNTIAIPFPSEAGTVYGGTLDVTTGLLTVDRHIVPKQEILNATTEKISDVGSGCFVYSDVNAKSTDASVANDKLISTTLPTKSQTDIYNGGGGGIVGCAIWWSTVIGIGTGDAQIIGISSFKAWWENNGGDIVYPLSTPITYQLTPHQIALLRGNNTLYANCGSMELKYYRIEGGVDPYV